MAPLILILFLLNLVFVKNVGVFVFIVFKNVVSAYSIVFLYRILTEILDVSIYRSLLLSMLFVSFAQILLVSFTPETYSMSLVLLLLTLLILGREWKKKDSMPMAVYSLLCVFTAGMTSTNGVKAGIAFLLSKNSIAKKIKWISFTLIVFGILTTLVNIDVIDRKIFHIIKSVPAAPELNESSNIYSVPPTSLENNPKSPLIGTGRFLEFDVDFMTTVRENLLGVSVMFHPGQFNYNFTKENTYVPYPNRGYYLFLGLFYSIVALAIAVSVRHKTAWVLGSFLAVDCFIHLVCRYGAHECYLYAPHWVFAIPLFLAFLYKEPALRPVFRIFDIVIATAAVILLANNLYCIGKFLVS